MSSLSGVNPHIHAGFLSPESTTQKADFLFDMQATFRRERHGIAGSWQYSDSFHADDPVRGSVLWEAFLKASNDYYPLASEIDLIHNHAKSLIGHVDAPVALVDFGPGPRQAVSNKTLPIASLFDKVSRYCPIDKSQDYLIGAASAFGERFPQVPVEEIHADFFKDEISLPTDCQPFALFFGSSISNLEGCPEDGLPESEIVWQLSRLRRIIGDDGSLLMAYDANQDAQSILKSYNHPYQAAFGSNIVYRMQRELPISGNFKPESWHYEAVWHPKTHQLCHTLVCDEQQSFSLGKEHFSVGEGERFVLNNSFKYPIEKMQEWGMKAGFSRQRFIQDSSKREVLHLMQT